MDLTPSCYTCFLEQASSVCSIVGASDEVRCDVLKEVGRILGSSEVSITPPEISDKVYAAIRRITGVDDPYYALKREYNAKASELLPRVMDCSLACANPLEAHVRASLFGNVIDFGCNCPPDLDSALDGIMSWDVPQRALEQLHNELQDASSLLFLTDNCGEIVFDASLISYIVETYGISSVSVAVKGGPWINDAMEEDAREAGIQDIPGVSLVTIYNGDAGTGLDRSSREFNDFCYAHDVILSKGQANWEMLEGLPGLFFLLMVKCPEIGTLLHKAKGDIAFYKS